MQKRFDVCTSVLHKRIVEGLQCCINNHGPIDETWIGSASKRIAQRIYALSDVTRDMGALEKENQILKERIRLLEQKNVG